MKLRECYQLNENRRDFVRIAIDGRDIIGKRAGIGTYVYEIILELDNRKEIDEIILFTHKSLSSESNKFSPKVKIVVIPFPNRYYPFKIFWEQILLKVLLDWMKPHLFIGMNFICPIMWKGKKIVVIHDVAYEVFPETKTKKSLKYFRKWVPLSINSAEKVITVSEHSKMDIIKYYKLEENNIFICSPSIDFNSYYLKENELVVDTLIKFNISSEYLLYIGTVEPRKNLITLLEAYKEIVNEKVLDCKLVICGKTGWLTDEVNTYIKEYNLQNNIIFTGYVSQEEKVHLLKKAKLFIFPSKYEGFGMPLLEAMVTGVPIIASNNSSIPEVVGDAALQFPSNDYKDLKTKIIQLYNSPVEKERLVSIGKQQVRKFTWEKSVDELLSVIKIFY